MLKGQDSFLNIGGISKLLRRKSSNCIHNRPIKDDTSPVVTFRQCFTKPGCHCHWWDSCEIANKVKPAGYFS
jgi:hypothetical protein